MAKMSEDRYFKRSGDRLYRMEHFDLEDMFGRRQKPKLKLHTRTIRGGSIGGGGETKHKAKLVLGIENIGRGVAKTPYLDVEVFPPYPIDGGGLDGNHHEGLPRLPVAGGKATRYGGSADNVIHPSLILEVAAVELTAVETHKLQLIMPRPLTLRYVIAAEGAMMVSGTYEMSAREVALATYAEPLHEGIPAE
jgi:hypothetical protein